MLFVVFGVSLKRPGRMWLISDYKKAGEFVQHLLFYVYAIFISNLKYF
jgi:hypothetical protein